MTVILKLIEWYSFLKVTYSSLQKAEHLNFFKQPILLFYDPIKVYLKRDLLSKEEHPSRKKNRSKKDPYLLLLFFFCIWIKISSIICSLGRRKTYFEAQKMELFYMKIELRMIKGRQRMYFINNQLWTELWKLNKSKEQ